MFAEGPSNFETDEARAIRDSYNAKNGSAMPSADLASTSSFRPSRRHLGRPHGIRRRGCRERWCTSELSE